MVAELIIVLLALLVSYMFGWNQGFQVGAYKSYTVLKTQFEKKTNLVFKNIPPKELMKIKLNEMPIL